MPSPPPPPVDPCPYCNMRYDAFRSPSVPSFQQAYQARFLLSQDQQAQGDYTVQAPRRHGILGMMRQAKLKAWAEEHLEWCRQEFESIPF